jgi:hypothetical protein
VFLTERDEERDRKRRAALDELTHLGEELDGYSELG